MPRLHVETKVYHGTLARNDLWLVANRGTIFRGLMANDEDHSCRTDLHNLLSTNFSPISNVECLRSVTKNSQTGQRLNADLVRFVCLRRPSFDHWAILRGFIALDAFVSSLHGSMLSGSVKYYTYVHWTKGL